MRLFSRCWKAILRIYATSCNNTYGGGVFCFGNRTVAENNKPRSTRGIQTGKFKKNESRQAQAPGRSVLYHAMQSLIFVYRDCHRQFVYSTCGTGALYSNTLSQPYRRKGQMHASTARIHSARKKINRDVRHSRGRGCRAMRYGGVFYTFWRGVGVLYLYTACNGSFARIRNARAHNQQAFGKGDSRQLRKKMQTETSIYASFAYRDYGKFRQNERKKHTYYHIKRKV